MGQPRLNVVGPRERTTRIKPKYSPRASWSYRYIAIANEEKIIVPPNLEEISIPLSEISDVTENVWLNSHPSRYDLKSPSEFGDKIVFMPKVRVFAFFSSHPVVSELTELARTRPREPNR
jgi:hypothetical protein